MYNDKVLKEFMKPENIGTIEDASAVGEVGSPQCGDMTKLYLKIENNIITDAKFQTFGCAAAIATSSVGTKMLIGKSIDDAKKITNKNIIAELGGLPPAKIHCSVMFEEVIGEALNNIKN
ncbi:MAG: iron-sulfur cluster assembly scaffold protein [Firmicutes bacterium]|nr:iron-sulfur cluster assembly scaffold protein [Bacillota bacterium]